MENFYFYKKNKEEVLKEPEISKISDDLYIQIPLTEDQKKLKAKDLALQLSVPLNTAYNYIKTGYISEKNKEYKYTGQYKKKLEAKQRMENIHKYLESVTPLAIGSPQELFGNKTFELKIEHSIKEFKENDKTGKISIEFKKRFSKKFSFENGQEFSIGDLILANIFIKKGIYRNNEGKLVMQDRDSKTIPVVFESIFKTNPELFYPRWIQRETPTGLKQIKFSNFGFWEIISPLMVKNGMIRSSDFSRSVEGSDTYEIFGAHERKITEKIPYVFFSNSNGGSKYYLGKDTFVGTNIKINHNTVSIKLLDNDTAGVFDEIHGRKEILFTFPLISKEEFENEKIKIKRKLETEGKEIKENKIQSYITMGAEYMKDKLHAYSITDYISQNKNESMKEYLERVSQLSDTGYMLKEFPVFMSELGIAAQNFKWKEQLILAGTLTNIQKETINTFGINFGLNGLRVFISLEHGGLDMGQKILDLAEQIPQETASKIFSKYVEIIDSIEKVLNVAQNNFKTSIDTKPELLQSIEQSLYKRGADLLSQFHDNINQNTDDIIAELDRINADTITTLSIFKYAAKFGNKLPLEDITGAEFSQKNGDQLNQAEIDEMEHIYQANWKNYGNQELIQSVIKKFKESLSGDLSNKERVYTFKKNNQINAFVKFSELQPGVKYASALNVDQSSKGFGLGETMMDEALYREAQENILIATCDPYNDSNMRYFEKGFIGMGFTGDNPPVMNICWNESMNSHIQSKHISSEDLIIMYLKQQVLNNLIIRKGKTLQEIHTDIPTGTSLTRCFRDPLHTGDWYAVYEPVNSEYETKIKTTE